ncbi:MAG: BNR repeat-containing protein [Phycisphaeraceae bacterium]
MLRSCLASCCVLAAICGVLMSASLCFGQVPAAPMKVTLMNDSVLEPQALNLVKGQFGTCFNGQTFQVDAVVTFGGWQYATYYDAKKRLCVARRQLPAPDTSGGDWQRITFDDYTISHNDVHNVPVIGICPADGTIHLAFDHHNSPLHYRVSKAGAATHPDKTQWTAALFGPTTSQLVSGQMLDKVTYPLFFTMPDGRLQLYFRIGGSGSGDSHLATYDPALGGPGSGGWTVLGEFINRHGDFQGSPTRNAYHNGFDYGPDGKLHTTWTWREGKDNINKWGLLNCHDLMYAWSDDAGLTWRNNDGQVIGTTGGKPMRATSPKITVRDLPYHWGMMNQLTQTVDSRGRVHAIMWQHPPDAPAASNNKSDWRYFHHWRDEKGQWHTRQLPCFGRKPSIIADRDGNLVLIFTKPKDLEYHHFDPGGPLHIYKATAARDWADWTQVYQSETAFVGEPRLDKYRWQQEQTAGSGGVLSIYAQEAPSKAGEPSVLHVLDFQVK